MKSLAIIVTMLMATVAHAQTYMGQAPGPGYVPVSTGPATALWVNGLPGLGGMVLPAGDTIGTPAGPGLNLNVATQPWIITGTATSPATDGNGGLLTVSKHTAYSSPALLAGLQPSIYAENLVEDGVWSNTAALRASLLNKNTQHSQPASTASGVALYGTAYCAVVACSATWASVIAAYDRSGQADPPHALYGLEIDVYANGTDAGGKRIGLQITSGSDPSVGSGVTNTVAHGLLFVGDGSGATPSGGQYVNLIDGFTAKAQNGIVLNSMSISGFAFLSPGFAVAGNGPITVGSTVGGVGINVITINAAGVGNLMNATGVTSTNGINLNGATFTNFAFLSPGFGVSGTGAISATLPTSAGGGGLSVCVDSAGVFYKKANCP